MKKSKDKANASNNLPSTNTNGDTPPKKDSINSTDIIQINKTIQNMFSSNTSNLETVSKDEDPCVTPKAQIHSSSDVRRWASVVKAKKNLLLSSESGASSDITPEIFDCVFKTFPKNVEAHKGFIACNESMFYCNVCHIELESVLNLSNHLKTRNHENNVISFLKQKIPQTLHYIFEFVSFYASNLCCNLCRCKIDMSSYNPFETIVNIMAHNITTNHASHKTSQGNENEAHTLIKSLAITVPEIKENLCFIEKKMGPLFKCQLCEKNILYSENLNCVTQNFVSHLKSTSHLKNQRAVEILKQFGEASINGKDNFTVVNGNISCIHCRLFVETNVEKLISHVNGVEHTKKVLEMVKLSPSITNHTEFKLFQKDDMDNERNSVVETRVMTEKKDCSNQTNEKKCKRNLSDALTSFADLNQISCLIENGKGSVTCILCNRIIPPSVHNIQTHLLGSNHKKNVMIETVDQGVNQSKSKSSELTKKQTSELKNLNTKSTLINEKTKLKKMQQELYNGPTNPASCLICQCRHSSRKNSQEHCSYEKIDCLLKCPQSSSKHTELLLKKKIEYSFRKSDCLKQQVLLPSEWIILYDKILAKNTLVVENKSFLETNVDLLHIYCNLCRVLIRGSVDLDIFECNIVHHLNGKIHVANLSNQNNGGNSIENISSVDKNIKKSFNNSQKLINENGNIENVPLHKVTDQGYTQLHFSVSKKSALMTKEPAISEDSGLKSLHGSTSASDENVPLNQNEVEKCTQLPLSENVDNINSDPLKKKKKESKQFTAKSKEDNVSLKSVAKKALPVKTRSCLLTYKEENDEDVLKRREKQISYGKNTLGYSRYCNRIPKTKRSPYHPETPPRYLKCSRRTWDGMVRVWRKQLHAWDPPIEASVSLDLDIQPLAALTLN